MGVVTSGLLALVLLQADPVLTTTPIVNRDVELPPEPVRFSAGVRAEVRSGHPSASIPSATTDLEIDPTVGMRIPGSESSLTMSYDPRIFIVASSATASPGSTAKKVSYLHKAYLSADHSFRGRWKLYFNGRGAYGDYDFLPLSTVIPGAGLPTSPTNPVPGTPTSPGTQIPGVGSLPDVRFLKVVELVGGAGVVHNFSPTFSWRLAGGYSVAGGANSDAQATLPLQKGPMGSTGPEWAVGPNDSVTALLNASYSKFIGPQFSEAPSATLLDLTATWSHRWSPSWQTDLFAGAGGFHATGPGRPVENKVLPIGGFNITHVLYGHAGNVRNTLQLRAVPLPDRLNGLVYERLESILISSVPIVERLWFDASGGAALTPSIDQVDIRLEARMTYAFTRQLGVSIGIRTAWLEGSTLLGPSGFGWLGFLNLTAFAVGPL